MTRRFILSLFFLFSLSSAFAVEYRSVGIKAEFCAYTFDGQYFLILSFKDVGDNRLSNNTIVKFKLNDGTVLRLEGYNGSTETSISSLYWGYGVSSSSSDEKHYAILTISPEQIEKLKIGVQKVSINTIPEVYKKFTWIGKAKFGQLLYDDFMNLRDEFDEVIIKDKKINE